MSSAQERTEEATPRRLRKARESGEVAKSTDFTSTFVLAISALALSYQLDSLTASIRHAARGCWTVASANSLDLPRLASQTLSAFGQVALALLPILSLVFVACLFVPFLQVGPLFTLKPLSPDLNRLNPAGHIKQQFFSSQTWVEFIKSLLKVVAVGLVCWITLVPVLRDVALLCRHPTGRFSVMLCKLVSQLFIRVLIFCVAMALLDLLYQRWSFLRRMRMTREERKRERRDDQGDPQVNSMRRQQQIEFATQSTLTRTREGDVVATNPTHLACVLRYDTTQDEAPRLVAKGSELLAERIKEVARELDIPITRNVTLARALWELEVDDYIPEALYEAVVEVLHWVEMVAQSKGKTARWAQGTQSSRDGQPERAS